MALFIDYTDIEKWWNHGIMKSVIIMKLIPIGFFHEMHLYADNGSVKDFIVDSIDYDKSKIIKYLQTQKRVAGCPKPAVDCVTGETISTSFSIYTDDEYEWCDFIIFHINKYNISLPENLIKKASAFL